jgi:hypothetical protein
MPGVPDLGFFGAAVAMKIQMGSVAGTTVIDTDGLKTVASLVQCCI